MATHAEKTPSRQHQANEAVRSPRVSAAQAARQGADHRPPATLLEELQAVAERSPQATRLRALHDIANQGPHASNTAQLQALADRHSARQTPPLQKQGNGSALPGPLQSGVEALSGYAMDDVRVHFNSAMPARVGAHAYTQGTDIHVASGQDRHLPHEAWHVVQQKQGRVKPTLQMTGVAINDEPGLELEADVMGRRAVQMKYAALNQGGRSEIPDSSDHEAMRQPAIARRKLTISSPPGNDVAQRVTFLTVKRIASNGSLYTGLSVAGQPNLTHNGGTNWWGPKATANEYARAPGGVWEARATRALNLITMSTAKGVSEAMEETIRRSQGQLSQGLQQVLQSFDFAYAVPITVARTAEMCLQYARDQLTQLNGTWTDNSYVQKQDVDNALQLASSVAEIPLWVGSVIQQFAGHNSPNAVPLNDPNFLANPNAYCVLRKDATNLDAGFVNALLQDLNNPAMFHGLHVPQGMKFGGWTSTKFEILIKNAPNNLAVQPNAVNVPGPQPDLQVTDKQLGVDDSDLARTWRRLGRNN